MITEHDIERGARERQLLRRTLDKRNINSDSSCERACMRELLSRYVDTYCTSADLKQSERPLRPSATKFKNLSPVYSAKDIEFRFRNSPHAPSQSFLGEGRPVCCLV